jgi:hypothetical protein
MPPNNPLILDDLMLLLDNPSDLLGVDGDRDCEEEYFLDLEDLDFDDDDDFSIPVSLKPEPAISIAAILGKVPNPVTPESIDEYLGISH